MARKRLHDCGTLKATHPASRREDTIIAQGKRSAPLGYRPNHDSASRRVAANPPLSVQNRLPQRLGPRMRHLWNGSRQAAEILCRKPLCIGPRLYFAGTLLLALFGSAGYRGCSPETNRPARTPRNSRSLCDQIHAIAQGPAAQRLHIIIGSRRTMNKAVGETPLRPGMLPKSDAESASFQPGKSIFFGILYRERCSFRQPRSLKPPPLPALGRSP